MTAEHPGSSGDDLGRTDADTFGLRCWSGLARPMVRAHRHDDIEVNVVVSGRLDYLFGARAVSIPTGATSVFWAALPHQLVGLEPGSVTHWLTVPLATVLRWRTADALVAELLSGAPLLALEAPDAADRSALQHHFARWPADLAADDEQLTGIVLLEIEAFLRRVLREARSVGAEAAEAGAISGAARSRTRAAVMAGVVATRFRESLTVEDVAAAVHLNAHYAMKVFSDAVGTTIGGYLSSCRLAEAQRLLITTSLTVVAVAHSAGFGSLSRLYAAFADAGLPPPAAYRRQQQQAAGWSRVGADRGPQTG